MYKIKRKATSKRFHPHPRRLTVTLRPKDKVDIDYDQANPPHLYFDTNVLRGLNEKDADALRRLQSQRGFQYRYSMLNFTELVSHLDDPPTDDVPDPFRKFQAPFKKMLPLFHQNSLPSPEMVLMQATGLKHYLDSKWVVDFIDIAKQVSIIAEATSLEDIQKHDINPAHYKKLRQFDSESFISMMTGADTLDKPLSITDESATWLLHIYSFLIYRASGGRIRLAALSRSQQSRVIKFFNEVGGTMFKVHLLKLLQKTINDGRTKYGNDFYDLLQLLLLRDTNLLFVTDDSPFFSYYAGPEHHRVVPWRGFKASAGN
ncbi:MAG: hypothetical protein HY203_01555 [Nitrospirae bacterium]|nr:hypothetical protein [Nitrospirota bacterium]